MSVIIQNSVVVPTGTETGNLIQGQLHEFLAGPSIVQLYATASTTQMSATLLVGSETFMDQQRTGDAGRMPIVPDDKMVDAAGGQGERITLRARNDFNSDAEFFYRIEITQVG